MKNVKSEMETDLGGCGWSRTTNLALMRRLLCRLSYTAISIFVSFIRIILEARGGVEPRAFPPDALRFGLEDRCRERGPDSGGDGEIHASLNSKLQVGAQGRT